MKKYTIGLITGALLAISAMMFIGASSQDLDYEIVNNGIGFGDIYLVEINKRTGDVSKVILDFLQAGYKLELLGNIKK